MLNHVINIAILIIGHILLYLTAMQAFGIMDTSNGIAGNNILLALLFSIIFIQSYFFMGRLIRIKKKSDIWIIVLTYLIVCIFAIINIPSLYDIVFKVLVIITYPIQLSYFLLLFFLYRNYLILASFLSIIFPLILIILGIQYSLGNRKLWIANVLITILLSLLYSMIRF